MESKHALETRLKITADKAIAEGLRGVEKHGGLKSFHEAYAVLLEEVDELWHEAKHGTPERLKEEALQVAAVALRMAAYNSAPVPVQEDDDKVTINWGQVWVRKIRRGDEWDVIKPVGARSNDSRLQYEAFNTNKRTWLEEAFVREHYKFARDWGKRPDDEECPAIRAGQAWRRSTRRGDEWDEVIVADLTHTHVTFRSIQNARKVSCVNLMFFRDNYRLFGVEEAMIEPAAPEGGISVYPSQTWRRRAAILTVGSWDRVDVTSVSATLTSTGDFVVEVWFEPAGEFDTPAEKLPFAQFVKIYELVSG